MKFLHAVLAKMTGKNRTSTPTQVIKDQLLESRPLPMGRKEFESWSNRIIAGALVPSAHKQSEEAYNAFEDSQKCTLAGMIMHLGPTESHKPDAFFIHSLRKAAVNQVAHDVGTEYREKAKKRLAEKEALEKKEAENEGI